jgi:hypothetical protein
MQRSRFNVLRSTCKVRLRAHAEQLGGEGLAREPDIVFSSKARLSKNGSCSTPRLQLRDACVIIPAMNAIMMRGEMPWSELRYN